MQLQRVHITVFWSTDSILINEISQYEMYCTTKATEHDYALVMN